MFPGCADLGLFAVIYLIHTRIKQMYVYVCIGITTYAIDKCRAKKVKVMLITGRIDKKVTVVTTSLQVG